MSEIIPVIYLQNLNNAKCFLDNKVHDDIFGASWNYISDMKKSDIIDWGGGTVIHIFVENNVQKINFSITDVELNNSITYKELIITFDIDKFDKETNTVYLTNAQITEEIKY